MQTPISALRNPTVRHPQTAPAIPRMTNLFTALIGSLNASAAPLNVPTTQILTQYASILAYMYQDPPAQRTWTAVIPK